MRKFSLLLGCLVALTSRAAAQDGGAGFGLPRLGSLSG
jgi:hypothetical protein